MFTVISIKKTLKLQYIPLSLGDDMVAFLEGRLNSILGRIFLSGSSVFVIFSCSGCSCTLEEMKKHFNITKINQKNNNMHVPVVRRPSHKYIFSDIKHLQFVNMF